MIKPTKIALEARDVTGQNVVRTRVSSDWNVGEVVRTLVDQMQLSRTDSGGRTLAYQARLESRGQDRHLNPSEIAGEVIQENDRVSLHPDINAGGRD